MLHKGKEPQHLFLSTWRYCFVLITLRGSVEPMQSEGMDYIDSSLEEQITLDSLHSLCTDLSPV